MARLMGTMPSERDYRYRTGYDQRQGLESNRYYAGSPYGERLEGPYESRKGYGSSRRDDDDPDVIELMVPMCCEKCREKVEEELGEVEGVENVYCDQDRDRVTVTGNDIDTERLLVKAKRAVKKECELISGDSDDDEDEGGRSSRRNREYYGRESSTLSSGRPSLGRMPSFASGRTVYNDGLRGRDYEEKDYSGFRRMPSLRYHEAEYITSFNQRPVPLTDSRRDYYNVRRMPSFRNHRYHDAEYVNTGDLGYTAPRTFYEDSGTPYTAAYDERPVYRSQVSFSRLPGGRVVY